MRFLIWVFAALVGCQAAALAQNSVASKDAMKGTPIGPDGALPPSPYLDKPLPELKGVVSWKTLAQVQAVKVKDRFMPQFSNSITALDKKEVRLQGFMMPLDMGEKQKRFILSALPPSCAFCLPGGPDQLVEVQAKTAVKYGFDPIVLSGRLTVLRDDPMGLYYRLTEAVPVAQ
jgi:hypothetical protein